MKEISKKLYNQISKICNDSRIINKTNISINEKLLLHFLFKELDEAHKSWNKFKFKIHKEHIEINNGDNYPRGNSFDYAKDDTKTAISNSIKLGAKYTFTIELQNITVYILYCLTENENNKKPTQKQITAFLNSSIYKIYLWFYIAGRQKPHICADNLTLYVYMTNLAKNIAPIMGTIIDREHVNSAFTTSCQKNIEIHIYREEDWFKTLIHESFHCFGFDFSHRKEFCDYSQKQILDLFSVKSDVNLFETYCEVWGEYLNIIIYLWLKYNNNNTLPHKHLQNNSSRNSKITINSNSKTYKNNHKKYDNYNIEKNYKKLIFYEKQFSLLQMLKVLKHYNLSYIDFKNNTPALISNFKENTNVLSYYLLKAIYLWNIDEFVNFAMSFNEKSTPFLFRNNQQNIREYVNIIAKYYKNASPPTSPPTSQHASQHTSQIIYKVKLFENNIAIYENWIKHHMKKTGNKFMTITLKMMILEY